MSDKLWEQAMAQLPKDSTVVRKYTGFEDGTLRWVVRLADGRETRYIVHFEGEDVRLEHRP